jgi:hypothetical protein
LDQPASSNDAGTDTSTDRQKYNIIHPMCHAEPLLAQYIPGPIAAHDNGQTQAALNFGTQWNLFVTPEIWRPDIPRLREIDPGHNDAHTTKPRVMPIYTLTRIAHGVHKLFDTRVHTGTIYSNLSAVTHFPGCIHDRGGKLRSA